MTGIDIYFISNQTNELKEIYPEFRVAGKQPEAWDAVTGSIRQLPAYEQKDRSILVPIKLAPYESTFVVFRKSASNTSLNAIQDNYPELALIEELEVPWEVSFDQSGRGPEELVTFEELHDWTTLEDERIRYYSGEATYTIKFTLSEKQEEEIVFIDLGD